MRYADLTNGVLPNGTEVYATILTYPFTAEGESLASGKQPNILARVSDYINPLSSSAFTIRESAITDSAANGLITRFIAAMYGANKFLQGGIINEACSTAAIASQINVTASTATLELQAATNNVSGETSNPGGNFTVSTPGVLNVISVRKEFGGFADVPANFDFNAAITPGTGKLIDYSIRDAAVKDVTLNFPILSCIELILEHVIDNL